MINLILSAPDVHVKIQTTRPRFLASLRGFGHAQNYISRLFELLDDVWAFLRANPQVEHEGLNVFLYHGVAGKNLLETEQGLPIEAGVIVSAPFESDGKVICSAIPTGKAATAVHLGPYENLGHTHNTIRTWCEQNLRPLAGPSWEIYDHWTENAEKLRTDVFYLLKE
jgi:effector-binding domain-containing protein